MSDDWTPAYRLQKARERERVVTAIVTAQSHWQRVLEVVAESRSGEEAQQRLQETMDLTPEQAMAVLDTQFRRVSAADRDRVAAELEALRAEIADLEREQ